LLLPAHHPQLKARQTVVKIAVANPRLVVRYFVKHGATIAPAFKSLSVYYEDADGNSVTI